jgi:hypothetical protein
MQPGQNETTEIPQIPEFLMIILLNKYSLQKNRLKSRLKDRQTSAKLSNSLMCYLTFVRRIKVNEHSFADQFVDWF